MERFRSENDFVEYIIHEDRNGQRKKLVRGLKYLAFFSSQFFVVGLAFSLKFSIGLFLGAGIYGLISLGLFSVYRVTFLREDVVGIHSEDRWVDSLIAEYVRIYKHLPYDPRIDDAVRDFLDRRDG